MVYRLAVVTSKELRERFGWSEQQLRRRLAALRAAGVDGLRRGPNGVYLIPEDLAKVLAEIARLEKDGLGPSEALRRALEGVNGLLPPNRRPARESGSSVDARRRAICQRRRTAAGARSSWGRATNIPGFSGRGLGSRHCYRSRGCRPVGFGSCAGAEVGAFKRARLPKHSGPRQSLSFSKARFVCLGVKR